VLAPRGNGPVQPRSPLPATRVANRERPQHWIATTLARRPQFQEARPHQADLDKLRPFLHPHIDEFNPRVEFTSPLRKLRPTRTYLPPPSKYSNQTRLAEDGALEAMYRAPIPQALINPGDPGPGRRPAVEI